MRRRSLARVAHHGDLASPFATLATTANLADLLQTALTVGPGVHQQEPVGAAPGHGVVTLARCRLRVRPAHVSGASSESTCRVLVPQCQLSGFAVAQGCSRETLSSGRCSTRIAGTRSAISPVRPVVAGCCLRSCHACAGASAQTAIGALGRT